jgi:hypothetical protein
LKLNLFFAELPWTELDETSRKFRVVFFANDGTITSFDEGSVLSSPCCHASSSLLGFSSWTQWLADEYKGQVVSRESRW